MSIALAGGKSASGELCCCDSVSKTKVERGGVCLARGEEMDACGCRRWTSPDGHARPGAGDRGKMEKMKFRYIFSKLTPTNHKYFHSKAT